MRSSDPARQRTFSVSRQQFEQMWRTLESLPQKYAGGEGASLYTIATAEREKLRPGTRVRITGEVPQMSMCQQGTTIGAAKIEILK